MALDKAIEVELAKQEETICLSKRMFYAFDDNHCNCAWREYIEQEYYDDQNWALAHGRPMCSLFMSKEATKHSLLQCTPSTSKCRVCRFDLETCFALPLSKD